MTNEVQGLKTNYKICIKLACSSFVSRQEDRSISNLFLINAGETQ